MKLPGRVRLMTWLFACATILPTTGCDWFQASDNPRTYPVISGLSVSPASVFCGESYQVTVAFDYDDPQEDIFQVLMNFAHTRLDDRLEKTVPWGDVDSTSIPGRASATFFFECGGPPAGVWTVAVQVEDEKAHLSNALSGQVNLLSTR
jgi:hypothetical protein